MRRLLWFCLLNLSFLIGPYLWAQNDPDQITLGVPLKLGMAQEHVLAEVGKHYSVKPLTDPAQFVVFTKPSDSTEKPNWEGMLTFKEGRLASVERLWAYENDDNSVALTKSLVSLLSGLVKTGKSTCVVQALLSDSPDAQGETVFLICGKRTLKISVAKVQGYKEDASVSETLE